MTNQPQGKSCYKSRLRAERLCAHKEHSQAMWLPGSTVPLPSVDAAFGATASRCIVARVCSVPWEKWGSQQRWEEWESPDPPTAPGASAPQCPRCRAHCWQPPKLSQIRHEVTASRHCTARQTGLCFCAKTSLPLVIKIIIA